MRAELEREYIEFVESRIPALRRMACQLAGDAHRGDDLVQQAITRLYRHWRRVRDARDIDAYANRVLMRVFLDERRLGWARVSLTGAAPDQVVPPAQGEVEDREVVRAALAKVPPKQRAVLVLRFLADRSVEETADILGCAPGTVKSQTAHGLAALRAALGDSLDDLRTA